MNDLAMKIYQGASIGDTRGQSWSGDDFEQNLELCEYQRIRLVFTHYLTEDMKILEAGCGLGRWVFYLRKKGYTAWGVELSDQALAIIRPFDAEGYIRKGDVCDLPFAKNSFDAVLSLGVVEHFEQGPEKALAEARRILTDQGLLLISIPPDNLLRKLISHRLHSLWAWNMIRKGGTLSFAEYRFSEKEFRGLLEKCGFIIDSIVTDELEPPKNLGLYIDFFYLQSKKGNWELNKAGLILERILRGISPAICRGGVLFVCRKNG
jgi:SAM-dependent methyltransferase